jgi:four helix bundle protein
MDHVDARSTPATTDPTQQTAADTRSTLATTDPTQQNTADTPDQPDASDNPVVDKSFAFAVRAVRGFQYLCRQRDAAPIAQQFVRAATSIGANLAEAQDAQSHADFAAKVAIALKEARETHYWIRLMEATSILSPAQSQSLQTDCEELLRLLTTIVKTARARRNR